MKGKLPRYSMPQRPKVQKHHKEIPFLYQRINALTKELFILNFLGTLTNSTILFSRADHARSHSSLDQIFERKINAGRYHHRHTIVIVNPRSNRNKPKMLTLRGDSPDTNRPTPPLQHPPQNPGERAPHINHRRSHLPNPSPFQCFPNGNSPYLSHLKTTAVHSYRTPPPLESYVKHQAFCERQYTKSLEPKSQSQPLQSQFLDHNAVGILEGEEDLRDMLDRRAREGVLNPPPRSFIEELKWLVLILVLFLVGLGAGSLLVGVISSILCLVVRWSVGCLACERSV